VSVELANDLSQFCVRHASELIDGPPSAFAKVSKIWRYKGIEKGSSHLTSFV
jgi:hypothetical protein